MSIIYIYIYTHTCIYTYISSQALLPGPAVNRSPFVHGSAGTFGHCTPIPTDSYCDACSVVGNIIPNG